MMLTKVKEQRLRRGLRQVDVSNITGLSQIRVSQIEQNFEAGADKKVLLAHLYNTNVDALFQEDSRGPHTAKRDG